MVGDLQLRKRVQLVNLLVLVVRTSKTVPELRAQLVKSLKGVDVFPDYPICDSALLPMMSKQVRRTCASFPAQARELVLKNGVEFETFQALLDKAERNPMYRWKLARAVRKLKRRQRAALEAKKV